MKKCNHCGIEKELSDYYLSNKHDLNSHRSSCKKCNYKYVKKDEKYHKNNIERQAKWQKNNYDKFRALQKTWQISVSGRFHRYQRAAKSRGLEFNLTQEQFKKLTQQRCTYCNNFSQDDFSGVDRTDNTKGYNIDNCVACCQTCNIMKLTHDEKTWLDKIKSIYEHRKLG